MGSEIGVLSLHPQCAVGALQASVIPWSTFDCLSLAKLDALIYFKKVDIILPLKGEEFPECLYSLLTSAFPWLHTK